MRSPFSFRVAVRRSRESGNAVLLAILLLSLLAALSAAQFVVVQKNAFASNFFHDTSDLRKYAESGVDIALHDLSYNLSANPGMIGTVNWTSADDVGQDGVAGTGDLGEGDGLPTHGEPNVNPVPIGSAGLGGRLSVYVSDTEFPSVVRIAATVSNTRASATVETYARNIPAVLPKPGAIYVDRGVALDLKGNSFLVDGRDHNLDGSLNTSAPATPGISTAVGDPAGANQVELLAQIPASRYTQIRGLGGSPSLAEDPVDMGALVDSLKLLQTRSLAAGTYTNMALGNPAQGVLPVTYVEGDLTLAGVSKGGGVLVVDGSLTLTGQFQFQGVILVTGDVRLSGGGAGVHILGSLMVRDTLTAVDLGPSETRLSGNSEVLFSSEAIDRAQAALQGGYTVVYYQDR